MANINDQSTKPEGEDGGDVKFRTAAPDAPVTYERPVPTDLDKFIKNPAVPRASEAVSKEMPHGTENYEKVKDGRTVLQQHVSFFDHDGDGIITPWDTFVGFRELGFNILFSFGAMVVIHLAFSWISQDYWFPNPFFWIYTKNIHRGKHGSDSGTYDHEGRFVPEEFESIFSKYAKKDPAGQTITAWELLNLTKGQRNFADPFGWAAVFFEWLATFLLLEHNGKLRKEDIRELYDGSLFYNIREQRRRQNKLTSRQTGNNTVGSVKRGTGQIGHELHQRTPKMQ
ncbi:caleosin domain protein [Endogone sp. FLAS-F59071]|nr:caleosin domain protein [Endogone sp. FLAS-F59071]|eukprot:RUS22340.1 caleosin domain protein [Endogone sp. FLAS-F59071]